MRKQGFTLFEMLIVVAILSMLITAFFGYTLNTMKASARNRFKSNLDSSAAKIINFMGDSLKGAWQTEIVILGSEGQPDMLLGSAIEGEFPIVGKGLKIHVPDLTKSLVASYDWDKIGLPSWEDDYKNNSYAISFEFDDANKGIELTRHIPTEEGGYEDYTRLALAGFVDDFKIKVKTSDFIDVELKLNYKGDGSTVSPFKHDFYNILTFSYNVRNKQLKDNWEGK